MKTSDRCSTRVTFPAFLLIGLLGGATASAADDSKPGEGGASCRDETRRVAVWQQGGNPKSNQHARFETRVVKVCDGKVVSQSDERSASNR
jgi:hypothetical protein